MPIYEYRCPDCGDEKDSLRPVSERDNRTVCPADGCGADMKRIVSKTSFSLQGGGWFKDGYTKKQ